MNNQRTSFDFAAEKASPGALFAVHLLILKITIFSLITWSLCACAVLKTPPATPVPTPTFTPAPTSTPAPTRSLRNIQYLIVLEDVWSTVNETFFDPELAGLDWEAVYKEYEQLVLLAEDDEAFYQLLNQMLWQLNVSHVGVGPVEVWPSVEPVVWGKAEIGIDIRLLEDQAVITRIESGSPAEQAGIHPGFILQSIAGLPVEQILAGMEGQLAPPHNEAGRTDLLTRKILSLIYGEPGGCVPLTYLDNMDALNEACLERMPRLRIGEMGDIIPPAYLEFESSRLEDGFGYIRFNTFHQDLIPDLIKAVAELQDAPGLIIDLRGNPGGDPIAAETMAGQFLEGDISFGSFKSRDGILPRLVTGKNVYSGPLVILIDALSFSASEYFSSNMQMVGRAAIIGERTPGGLTGMNFKSLSNGALLGYPVVQLITPDGRALEGIGVIPDITVSLERSQLLAGIDTQLQAAIEYLSSRAGEKK